jgi:hypothetical protein
MSSSPTGSPTRSAVPGGFSRRSLLVAAAVGTAALATGCTGDAEDAADAVTPAQVDQLAAQVDVQAAVVTAYDRAVAAAPELAAVTGPLADQARRQLDRLRAAAPGGASDPTAPSPGAAPDPAPDAAGAREWLHAQVVSAADAHAAACPGFTGARAALLGSIAAGLHGQGAQLG